jgi:hypothetical protein
MDKEIIEFSDGLDKPFSSDNECWNHFLWRKDYKTSRKKQVKCKYCGVIYTGNAWRIMQDITGKGGKGFLAPCKNYSSASSSFSYIEQSTTVSGP